MNTYMAEHDELIRDFHITIEEVSSEYSRVSMPLQNGVRNASKAAHGGAIFTLADVAFGSSANFQSPTMIVSLNASIEYLRPGLVGPLTAEAHLLHGGKNLVRYEVQVKDGNGVVIAQMLTTGARTKITHPGQ